MWDERRCRGLRSRCLAASAAWAADPYKIPAIMALTGQGAFIGKGEQQGLQLAEKVANAAGGIKGRPLEFVFQDDQTNPQVAVQLASDVLGQKPQVMVGGSIVATCRAIAPLAKAGPVDYCLSPGIHPEKGDYVFSGSVSTLDLATALVRYFRMKGWTRIGLMFSSDATGQDAENGLKSVLALPDNKDMQIVATAHFNITDVSVSAQIETVKAANPQCFIAWSTGTPIATIFRGIRDQGLDVPIGTTDGNMTYAQMTQYADFLPKQLYIPAGAMGGARPQAACRPRSRSSTRCSTRPMRIGGREARCRVGARLGAGLDPHPCAADPRAGRHRPADPRLHRQAAGLRRGQRHLRFRQVAAARPRRGRRGRHALEPGGEDLAGGEQAHRRAAPLSGERAGAA